jgi:opacity protein-like surface antigen
MDAEPDEEENWDNVAGYVGPSDDNLFIGGGAKWTLAKAENFSWGFLTQVSWANLDFDEKRYSIGGYSVRFSTELEIVEVQIATGPTFDLTENISFYGGPFLYFLNGDADLEGMIDGLAGTVTTELEQESIIGGYIGTEIRVVPNIAIGIEYQEVSGSRGIGGQLAWRF